MQHVTAVSRFMPCVYQAAATASVHKNSTLNCHMIPRFDFSQLRIETAAFALQLTSACMWSAGQHAEPTCESSIGVARFITVIATAKCTKQC